MLDALSCNKIILLASTGWFTPGLTHPSRPVQALERCVSEKMFRIKFG